MPKYADITGWGKCMPPAVMTNDDFASVIDTSDEWIRTRSGIAERRVSHVPNSDLAAVAAMRAMAAAGAEAEEIDLLILATTSGDNIVPSTASYVQAKTGTLNAAVFDLNAGCSGFIYGLETATAMIRAAGYRKVLVIGSERLTWLINFADRSSGVLFGDGAGAVVLEPSDRECGLLGAHLGCDGRHAQILEVPNSGTAGDRFIEDYNVFKVNFDGREIFKRAVKGMAGEVRKVLGDLELGTGDIDVIIPHQANLRIIESLAHYLRVPMEQVAVNIERYGNTSAATIPVALCELLEQGRIKPGDRLLLAAFGAGLTRAAGLIRWGERATPLGESDAELPPCDKTALEILADAIEHTLKD
jgi:3-oxoacyl-[acyl-carrier-protein] synthase-3